MRVEACHRVRGMGVSGCRDAERGAPLVIRAFNSDPMLFGGCSLPDLKFSGTMLWVIPGI
jgi:hypothetical protein